MRLRGLGVIGEAVLELGPGLTVVTGETGAGKTMVVTGLGCCWAAGPTPRRSGRASRRRRRGPGAARPCRCRPRGGPRTPAPSSTTATSCSLARTRLGRGPQPRAPRRPVGPGRPARRARRASWSRCTARATSCGCAPRPASARRSTGSPARGRGRRPGGLPRTAGPRLRAVGAELAELTEQARERAPRPSCCGSVSPRSSASSRSPVRTSSCARRSQRLAHAEELPRPPAPRTCCSAATVTPPQRHRRCGRRRPAGGCAPGAGRRPRARPGAGRARPTGSPSSATCWPTLAAELRGVRGGRGVRPGAAGRGRRSAGPSSASSPARTARTSTRCWPWADAAGRRLLELDGDGDRLARAARRARRADASAHRAGRQLSAASGEGRRHGWPARQRRAGRAGDAPAPRCVVDGPRPGGRRCGPHGVDEVELLLVAARRARRRARWPGRLRRRAVPGDARPRGRARRCRARCRRSSSTRSTPGSAARPRSRSAAGWRGWPAARRCSW